MKRYATLLIATLAALGLADAAKADWGFLAYGGCQPWWNPFGIGKRHGQKVEERRLQRFWHDYYDAQRRYYRSLEHLDWVTYYKNHGQQINGGYAGCQAPVQFAPVTVSPSMAWANPSGAGAYGAPAGGGGFASNGPPPGYYALPAGSIFPGYSPPSSVVAPSEPVSTVSYPFGD
jgi:hypothetical protein